MTDRASELPSQDPESRLQAPPTPDGRPARYVECDDCGHTWTELDRETAAEARIVEWLRVDPFGLAVTNPAGWSATLDYADHIERGVHR